MAVVESPVDETLRTTLCDTCSDPLGDEPVVEAPDHPGWLCHLDCEMEDADA